MRLQHVSICIAKDGAERAREFYGGLLGLEERSVPPKLDGSMLIWYRVGGTDNELHLMLTGGQPPDAAHLCLVVDGDLAAHRKRLEDAGVETRDATEIVGRPRFFCRDPFGNLVELTVIEEYR